MCNCTCIPEGCFLECSNSQCIEELEEHWSHGDIRLFFKSTHDNEKKLQNMTIPNALYF